MLGWDNDRFSLDNCLCLAGHDRAGQERLLRRSACPPFGMERLWHVDVHRVTDRLPKCGATLPGLAGGGIVRVQLEIPKKCRMLDPARSRPLRNMWMWCSACIGDNPRKK
jgi:hypothetical protein